MRGGSTNLFTLCKVYLVLVPQYSRVKQLIFSLVYNFWSYHNFHKMWDVPGFRWAGHTNFAIIGWQVYLDTETRMENCINIRWYCKTWCTKKDTCSLFSVVARSNKMSVRKTSTLGEVYLFSDTVVCAFSEAVFGEILASIWCPKTHPNSQYIFVAVAILNTQGCSWTWNSPIFGQWNLSFLAVFKLKSLQY